MRVSKVSLSRSKIVNHRFIPESLELRLTEWSGRIDVGFILGDSSTIHTACRFDDRGKAEKAYSRMLKKLKSGDYALHIYGDGRAEIELK